MDDLALTSNSRIQRGPAHGPGYFLRVTPGDLPLACIFKHRWVHHSEECGLFFCFQFCTRCWGRQIRRVRFVAGDGYPALPDPSWAFNGGARP